MLLNGDQLPPVRYASEPQTMGLLGFETQPNLLLMYCGDFDSSYILFRRDRQNFEIY